MQSDEMGSLLRSDAPGEGMAAPLRWDLRAGAGAQGDAKQAWTAFWSDPAQSRCVSGAPGIWDSLTAHWRTLAGSLPPCARVLDLGCGAGAVARLLLSARVDLEVTGVDYARIPFAIHSSFELLSDTPMESLPFGEPCFGAVVSQFGFEYSSRADTVRELGQVLERGATLSFLVHHADSSIVTTNRGRLQALVTFLGPPVRSAFCAGDVASFQAHMLEMRARHPQDPLVAELARCLPSRLTRSPRERVAIWNSLEDALAPERCLAESLDSQHVAPERLTEWLDPLQGLFDLRPVTVVRESDGKPIAWKVEGVRRN